MDPAYWTMRRSEQLRAPAAPSEGVIGQERWTGTPERGVAATEALESGGLPASLRRSISLATA